MLARIEWLFSTETTVLANARKTGDGVMEKEETGEQTERKMTMTGKCLQEEQKRQKHGLYSDYPLVDF